MEKKIRDSSTLRERDSDVKVLQPRKAATRSRAVRREAWRDLPDRSQSVGMLLRRAYQFNMALFQRYSPDAELTLVQLAGLYAIAETQPCSLTDVGRLASTDPSTTRGIIDRLLKRGFVKIEPDEKDRRRVMLTLTEAGQRITEEMVSTYWDISNALTALLNPAERVALVFLLQKMLSKVQDLSMDSETRGTNGLG